MTLRDMRARCEELLDGLELPDPFDMHEFCRRLGTRRGRPIVLRGADTAALGLPGGVWNDMDDADLIIFNAKATGYHQIGIVLHEIGHILGNHYAGELLNEDVASALLPATGRLQLRRVAARHDYAREEEREAEFFARFVLVRVGGHLSPGDGATDDPRDREELDRLGDTFEG